MVISDQIVDDYSCLKKYFEKLFALQGEAEKEECEHFHSDEIMARNFIQISHFIKPDMLINIYSFLDYYAKRICKSKKEFFVKLELSVKDIKGDNELQVYHKYLTKYLGIDLSQFQKNYEHLQNLREVRNCFIHSGGHIGDKRKVEQLNKIVGIQISDSIIYIDDSFVWQSLEHAKDYLVGAAKAGIPITKVI